VEILLSRVHARGSATIGEIRIDGDAARACWSLEDEVREVYGTPVADWKVPGKTAIPLGKYKVIVNRSERFKRMLPLLLDVEGFTGVRIHPGNTEADTEGCILVGDQLTKEQDAILGGTSRPAFERLFAEIQAAIDVGEEVWLTLENAFPV
jgi:hypothetical protein